MTRETLSQDTNWGRKCLMVLRDLINSKISPILTEGRKNNKYLYVTIWCIYISWEGWRGQEVLLKLLFTKLLCKNNRVTKTRHSSLPPDFVRSFTALVSIGELSDQKMPAIIINSALCAKPSRIF